MNVKPDAKKRNKTEPQKSETGGAGLRLAPTTRLAFVGFMGAGKTTVAASVAAATGSRWIDLDEFVVSSENRSINQIIQNLGENVFREIETEHLRAVARDAQTQVIALGGGVWTIEENRNILRAHKITSVWLDAPFELCWQRIKQNKDVVRPLAVNKTAARKLFAARRNCYAQADWRVEIAAETALAKVIEEIAENLNAAACGQKTLTKSE